MVELTDAAFYTGVALIGYDLAGVLGSGVGLLLASIGVSILILGLPDD